jgi:hypothetical protein
MALFYAATQHFSAPLSIIVQVGALCFSRAADNFPSYATHTCGINFAARAQKRPLGETEPTSV